MCIVVYAAAHMIAEAAAQVESLAATTVVEVQKRSKDTRLAAKEQAWEKERQAMEGKEKAWAMEKQQVNQARSL
jgi:hypothetical protein